MAGRGAKAKRAVKRSQAKAALATALVPRGGSSFLFPGNPTGAVLRALTKSMLVGGGAAAHDKKEERRLAVAEKLMPNSTGSEQKRGAVRSLTTMRSAPRYGQAWDANQCAKFRALAYELLGELQSGGGLRAPISVKTGLDFTAAGLPQHDVDRSFRTAIRVVVTDVDGGVGATTAGLIGASGSGGSASVGALSVAGGTGSAVLATDFAPSVLSKGLLGIIGEPWQYYAIRYVLQRLMPVASVFQQSTADAPLVQAPNSCVAYGIITDRDQSALISTFTGVSELEHSVVTQVTKPAEVEYCHTGTQLWSNKTGETEVDVDIQGAIVGAFDSVMAKSTAGTAQVPLMHIQTCAVVDYYGLRPSTASDELHRMCRKAADLGCTASVDEKGGTLCIKLPINSHRDSLLRRFIPKEPCQFLSTKIRGDDNIIVVDSSTPSRVWSGPTGFKLKKE